MREIKFRAWDKKDNEWLFGYEMPNLGGFSLIGEVVLMGELNSIPLERWNDVEIMQYTGLKDRNGEEIYEGDICEETLNSKKGILSEVVWNKRLFELKPKHNKYRHAGFHHQIVIGNIYENKDLLK